MTFNPNIMKSNLLFSILVLLVFTSCHPSFDETSWHNIVKPEMIAHKKFLKVSESYADYDEKKNVDENDEQPHRHTLEAFNYVCQYAKDSLDSYRKMSRIYEILQEKATNGTLYVENRDDDEEQLSGEAANLFMNAMQAGILAEAEEVVDTETALAQALLMGMFSGSAYENYTEKYVLNMAKYLQDKFNKTELILDFPEFEKKTKDRIIYSVYCPSLNESYTVSSDKKGANFHWSLEPFKK